MNKIRRLILAVGLMLCSVGLIAEENPPFSQADPAANETSRNISLTLYRHLHDGFESPYLRDILPETDSVWSIGASGREWLNGYFDNLFATTGTLTSLSVTSITASSLSVSTMTASSATISGLSVSTLSATSGTITTLSATTISASSITASATVITPNINGTFIGYGRNRIINGAMRINQRLVNSTGTINSTASTYTLDRWVATGQGSGEVFGIFRDSTTIPTGFDKSLRVTVTTADSSISSTQTYTISQKIEGSNVLDFLLGTSSAKIFTLSFWVRSTVTGTFSGSFRNSAANRSYPFTYTISSANTWEQKSVTVTGDTTGTWLNTTGTGLHLTFDLGGGTSVRGTASAWAASNYIGATGATSLISTASAKWYITGVQVEIGSTATAYEYMDMGSEIVQCQRYYEKSYEIETALGTSTNVGRQTFWASDGAHGFAAGSIRPFQVMKRATPTMTIYSITGASGNYRNIDGAADVAGGFQFPSQHDTGEVFQNSGNFTDGVAYGHFWTADAEL